MFDDLDDQRADSCCRGAVEGTVIAGKGQGHLPRRHGRTESIGPEASARRTNAQHEGLGPRDDRR
jgi:hypothetical protein